MDISLFDFDLPETHIALAPADKRDASRLLSLKGESISDAQFFDLPSLLQPTDVLVLNDTKVIPARLPLTGPSSVSVTLMERTHCTSSSQTWEVMAKPARRLKEGLVFLCGDVEVTVLGRKEARVILSFSATEAKFWALLDQMGTMPLPPYIEKQRPADQSDKERYQTVYASSAGAVAAPTAGLHFTDELLEALKQKGIAVEYVTLHVGAGTFLPVSDDIIEKHKIHAEYGHITPDVASRLSHYKSDKRRIIAVGTTSLRLLESAADTHGVIHPFSQETDIFIKPGYRFKAIDGLITNFHLPKSTLFMLVSALCGIDVMQNVYEHAIKENYRFYSYGDSSLLLPR